MTTTVPWNGKLPGTVFEMDDREAKGYAGSGVVEIVKAGASDDDAEAKDLPEGVPVTKAAVMDEPSKSKKGRKGR